MPNGHYSIPFSVAFVIKKLQDFQPMECTMDVSFTMIIRIKFTGLPNMEEVMTWVEKNLKCRVNEEEGPLINHGTREGKVNRVKSKDWKDGMAKDML